MIASVSMLGGISFTVSIFIARCRTTLPYHIRPICLRMPSSVLYAARYYRPVSLPVAAFYSAAYPKGVAPDAVEGD